MSKVTYGSRGGRVFKISAKDKGAATKSPEEVVREIRQGQQKPPGEDYRERSLALQGSLCARCGREFDALHRHLLTVHHKDGNHHNNPPDGSNWENLCAYCHEDVHSRGLLGDYLGGVSGGKESSLVYDDRKGGDGSVSALGNLGEKLKRALEGKQRGRANPPDTSEPDTDK